MSSQKTNNVETHLSSSGLPTKVSISDSKTSGHVQLPEEFPPAPQHKDNYITPQQEALHKRDRVDEVVGALNQGKLPTTAQVTHAIDKIEDENLLHDAARNMSPMGKKVVADTGNLLDSTKYILADKNENDQLQKVIFHSQRAAAQVKDSGKAGATKGVLTSEGQKSAQLLRDASIKASNVARLVATSSEFRKLLNDINLIFQEVFYSRLPEDVHGTGNTEDLVRGTTNVVLDKAKDIIRPHVEAYKEGDLSGREATQRTTAIASTHVRANLADVKLTPEQRDHLTYRFQNLMHEIQESPEYLQALDDLMDILSELSHHVGSAATQTKDLYATQGLTSSSVSSTASTKTLDERTSLSSTTDPMTRDMTIAIQNAKELVENFANHTSLNPLIATIKEFGARVKSDGQLREYMYDLKSFIHLSLMDPDFLIQRDYVPMGSSLIERGRFILTSSYNDLTNQLTDEIQKFNNNLQKDRASNVFARDLETLTSDLFLDARGRPTFKYELMKDLSKIIPILAKKLEYLPLPKIESSDENYDFALDNIVITCSNILPKHVQLQTETDMETYSGSLNNVLTFRILNIRAEAKDIAFYYKKKKGIAKLTDVGLVDLVMPKEGISVIMTIAPSHSDDHTFKAEHVETHIKDLKLNIHDSHHKILYKLFGSMINSRVRKQLETVITEKLYNYIYSIDGTVTQTAQKLRAMTLTEEEASKESKAQPAPEWGSKAFNVHERI